MRFQSMMMVEKDFEEHTGHCSLFLTFQTALFSQFGCWWKDLFRVIVCVPLVWCAMKYWRLWRRFHRTYQTSPPVLHRQWVLRHRAFSLSWLLVQGPHQSQYLWHVSMMCRWSIDDCGEGFTEHTRHSFLCFTDSGFFGTAGMDSICVPLVWCAGEVLMIVEKDFEAHTRQSLLWCSVGGSFSNALCLCFIGIFLSCVPLVWSIEDDKGEGFWSTYQARPPLMQWRWFLQQYASSLLC